LACQGLLVSVLGVSTSNSTDGNFWPTWLSANSFTNKKRNTRHDLQREPGKYIIKLAIIVCQHSAYSLLKFKKKPRPQKAYG